MLLDYELSLVLIMGTIAVHLLHVQRYCGTFINGGGG
jgi:hypothetical protein